MSKLYTLNNTEFHILHFLELLIFIVYLGNIDFVITDRLRNVTIFDVLTYF